jgi:CheY-like chemotaxis protein
MARPEILLVDDDAIRWTLGEVLEQGGFDVTTAANVAEAFKLITAETYRILADMM